MNMIAVFFGGLASIILGVLIYYTSPKLQHTDYLARNALSLFFVLAGLATFISGLLRRVQMKVNSVFLIQASIMIRLFWISLLYIPLFLLAVSGLIALTFF